MNCDMNDITVNDIIVQTEKACSMLPVEERDGLRAEVCGALKSTQLPKPNITKEERTAIRNIGKDEISHGTASRQRKSNSNNGHRRI